MQREHPSKRAPVRKIKPGEIEAHPTEDAIVVNFIVETPVPSGIDRKTQKKTYALPYLLPPPANTLKYFCKRNQRTL